MNLFQLYAVDLCVNAVMDCFRNLPSLHPSQVTHLITFSCTGMSAPGLDIQLTEKLKLNFHVERTCINFMGCYAGINALKVASHIARAEPEAVVLLAGVELCTLHYQRSEQRDQVIANALFADGAAACIVSANEIEIEKHSASLTLLNFYTEFEPSGRDEMTWSVGDFGFNLKLTSYVPDLIRKHIYSMTKKIFEKAKVKQEEIAYYALHPGGMKILEACEDALKISKEQNGNSYRILRDFGNMSSVTVFFVLNEYLKEFTKTDTGRKLLSCAFGPGLTVESMICEVS